jgi:methionine-rich copper-binding protein CopC
VNKGWVVGRARPLLVMVAVLCAGTVALLSPSDAKAHAEPDEIRPGDGAVVTTEPAQVDIVMSQELARREGGSDIDVIGPDGTEVTTEAATLDLKDRRRISVPLPADLQPGEYTVRWKTLSADDGDPAEGELTFTYDPSGQPAPGREQLDDDSLGAAQETPAAADGLGQFTNGGGSSGGTWVVAAAAGIAGIAIGAAGTFLLVSRRTGAVT